MPPLGKRKAQHEADEQFRMHCAQLYNGESPNLSLVEPTGLSDEDTTPPIPDDDDLPSPPSLPQDQGLIVVSARKKPRESEAAPPKGIRGVVRNGKVSDIVKATGKKIDVDFNQDLIMGPSHSWVASLIVNSIGSIIRARVRMTKESWKTQPLDEKRKLTDGLSVRTIDFCVLCFILIIIIFDFG